MKEMNPKKKKKKLALDYLKRLCLPGRILMGVIHLYPSTERRPSGS